MEHLLLKESLTKPECWNTKIPKSILCYNFHHGSVNSYHVGNTKERKLNSTKDGGRGGRQSMIFIASSIQIIVSVLNLTERQRHVSMKVLHAHISLSSKECSIWGRGEVHTRFWWENLRERNHLENLSVDGRGICKWNWVAGYGLD
jgi:hypothetical protein